MILFVDKRVPSLQSLKSSDFHDFLHNRRVGSWSPRSAHLLFMALSRFEIYQQQCEPHWDFLNTYVLRASNMLCDNPLWDIADTMCWEPQIGWDISQTDFWNVRIDCDHSRVMWLGAIFCVCWVHDLSIHHGNAEILHSQWFLNALLNQSLAENNIIE
jgi:hypothetical protein